MKAGRPEGVLVSGDWLAANLGAEDLRVVDVRGKVLPPGNDPRYIPKRQDYDAGHLPGAVFVDWTRDIVDPEDPVPIQVARPEAFAAKMTELGVGDGTLVVAYDDYNHAFAGRLAWALRFYGHEDVRILDGGWSRWVGEGRPTTREPSPTGKAPRPFTARERLGLRRTADQVQHALGDPGVLLIDARAPAQYEGTVTVAARGGHIPGARNVHYAQLVDATSGNFLPREELARVFLQAGVDPQLPREIVVYCNGGVTCTVPLAALHMLGREDAAVYDGSWNEWGNDPGRPIETVRQPKA